MFELQRLRAEHERAVFEFERANRAYFAQSISDRGDAYFAQYAEEHRKMLEEQATGQFAFHVLVADDGTVVGRFNLWDISESTADVGYRVAQLVTGRGVASAALGDLCRMARRDYGLRTLRASTSHENVASQRVLEKAGFKPVGPAEVGGRPGTQYQLDLPALEGPLRSSHLDPTN